MGGGDAGWKTGGTEGEDVAGEEAEAVGAADVRCREEGVGRKRRGGGVAWRRALMPSASMGSPFHTDGSPASLATHADCSRTTLGADCPSPPSSLKRRSANGRFSSRKGSELLLHASRRVLGATCRRSAMFGNSRKRGPSGRYLATTKSLTPAPVPAKIGALQHSNVSMQEVLCSANG